MTLGELITFLEKEDPHLSVQVGFDYPHSYRGFYANLAFEPCTKRTVTFMLDRAMNAIGTTYGGYKGGEFIMEPWTDVWLAKHGECGETLGVITLAFMLGDESILWKRVMDDLED